jgi:flagellar capping protein FliD
MEDKVKINARIPKSLYDWIGAEYGNVSQAVNEGLDLLRESVSGKCDTKPHKSPQNIIQELTNSPQVVSQIDENDIYRSSSQELTNSPQVVSQNDAQQQARIDDLKSQIQDLKEQLKTKDQQLEKKDNQIENLTNTMQSQAINIHDIINQKAIEAPGAKKPWWKFW